MKQEISEQLANALKACNNGAEESVVKAIEYKATNPFLIYPNDYVREEDLVAMIERKKVYSKKEITQALEDLLLRGVLRRKGNIFTGAQSYSVTREAISGNVSLSS